MISGTTHRLQQEVIALRWKIREIENKLAKEGDGDFEEEDREV